MLTIEGGRTHAFERVSSLLSLLVFFFVLASPEASREKSTRVAVLVYCASNGLSLHISDKERERERGERYSLQSRLFVPLIIFFDLLFFN